MKFKGHKAEKAQKKNDEKNREAALVARGKQPH
jgi:hypothetical protein